MVSATREHGDQLDRDGTAQRLVPCLPYLSHSALVELSHQPVTAPEELVSHCYASPVSNISVPSPANRCDRHRDAPAKATRAYPETRKTAGLFAKTATRSGSASVSGASPTAERDQRLGHAERSITNDEKQPRNSLPEQVIAG
ncbi:hypothetical protein GCM10022224_090820 [Nonomuraea antimicrobica]|uniref:Uncharacterized protein n=1 Tax=Nonomuraea antimicrobica TaxID=561173 RepID=A0ABP7E251_9ACTN